MLVLTIYFIRESYCEPGERDLIGSGSDCSAQITFSTAEALDKERTGGRISLLTSNALAFTTFAYLLVAVLLVGFLVVDGVMGFALTSKFTRVVDSRISLWLMAWEMFLHAPWLGQGPATFRVLYPLYLEIVPFPDWVVMDPWGGPVPWAHNLYLELLAERFDGGFDRVLGHRSAAANLFHQALVAAVHELQQLTLVPDDVFDGNVVDVTVGACIDDNDLVLDAHRAVQPLLEQLHQAIPASELGGRDRVELRTEGCERLEIAELGQVDLERSGHALHRLGLSCRPDARHRDAHVDRRPHT